MEHNHHRSRIRVLRPAVPRELWLRVSSLAKCAQVGAGHNVAQDTGLSCRRIKRWLLCYLQRHSGPIPVSTNSHRLSISLCRCSWPQPKLHYSHQQHASGRSSSLCHRARFSWTHHGTSQWPVVRFPVLQGSFWSVQRHLFFFYLDPLSLPPPFFSCGFPSLHLFTSLSPRTSPFEQLQSTSNSSTSTTACTSQRTPHLTTTFVFSSLALLCRNMVILILGRGYLFQIQITIPQGLLRPINGRF